MPDRILIIEDEEDLVVVLKDRLTSEGYLVTSVADGYRGERQAERTVYDLIILDVMLPGQDGFEVCRALRRKNVSTPIIMLTARDSNIDIVTGLRAGSDDYLAKPFDISVLLARIEALLRREHRDVAALAGHRYRFGGFALDTRRQELQNGKDPIELKAQEYKLLKFFVENPNRVIERNEILGEVWGYDAVTTTRTVDVHVAWLRQKLGEKKAPRFLHTVRGYGYRFAPEE